ncbi:efflux RND transporter periplasmic adaptor subunit [Cognatishimia maritima]|uniref:RND family efflux transporter, MFP subunit n=1 Tax=Cognatishimia maritima TaxID=870908 RepID=A0A1M5RQ10_9RHOB|nr:HlyD family efflux transporter periplasmic adaptor subunit [Cognatishimia maritima]SHH28427.1 RND family efflux transporter, MFP subunit [Cognatishimia maritima]
MRFLRQSLMGLFLFAVTVGLLIAAVQVFTASLSDRMSQERRAPQARERVFTANVQLAEPATAAPKMTAFGEIQSQRTLDIRAATGGTLTELAPNFQEGGRVEKGQLLARFDTDEAQDALARVETDLRAALSEQAEAKRALELAQEDWASAQAQLELRERALARQKDLETRGVGTEAAIETAELNLSNARQQELARRQSIAQLEARIDQSETQVARAKIAEAEAARNLADRQITASFSGALSKVSVIEGGLVSANERLARLIDPDALEVSFRVSTAQYARLLDEAGRLRPAEVTVQLDVAGLILQASGQISRDSAAVGEGQTGRLIFATLSEARGLKPGDFVSVAISEPPLPNVVTLPAAALDPQGRVMVVGDGERLQAVPVKLLRRQGDDILVSADRIAGASVVTRLTPVLGAGVRVKPVGLGEQAPEPTPDMVELTEEQRAKLVAFVQGNTRLPDDRKAQLLEQLAAPTVPAQMVNRLEQRMGG